MVFNNPKKCFFLRRTHVKNHFFPESLGGSDFLSYLCNVAQMWAADIEES
jgi:hypothetical protein